MKRRSFLVAASAATATVGLLRLPATAHADPSGPQLELDHPEITTRTDLAFSASPATAITVDTPLDDPRWGVPVSEHTTSFFDFAVTDPVATHVVHTDTELLIGLTISGAAAQTATYASCVIRGETGGFRSVTVALNEATVPFTHQWGGIVRPIVDPTHRVAAAADTITCVIAVPLADLSITGDPAGQAVRLNVVIDHDDMSAPATSVAPVRTSSNWYLGGDAAPIRTHIVDEDRAALVFLTAPAAVDRSSRPAAVSPLAAATLEYLSFARKRLHWQHSDHTRVDGFDLWWHSPHQEPVQVEADVSAARWFSVEFDHPAPLTPGLYAIEVVSRSRTGDDLRSFVTFDRDALIAAGDLLPGNQPVPPVPTQTVTPGPASEQAQALIDLVPEQAGMRYCGVPDAPDQRPDHLFTWSVDDPDRLIAKPTGTIYPHPDHPEDHSVTVKNKLDEDVTFTWHEDDAGNQYFFEAHLRHQKREHLYLALEKFAEQDPLGAARVVHRFAEVYPHWVTTNEYPGFNRPVDARSTPRHYYWGGSMTNWTASDPRGITGLARALRKVVHTDALDVLSDEFGVDVRAMIVDDLIGPALDFRRSLPTTYGNQDAASYNGYAMSSWVLGDSSLVHEVVEWGREYGRHSFLFDGFWREVTLHYHREASKLPMIVAGTVAGWNDPVGYESPRTGARFENLDMATEMEIIQRGLKIPQIWVYPDGHLLPLADAWASATETNPDLTIGSTLLSAGKVQRLTRGAALPADDDNGFVLPFIDLEVDAQTVPVVTIPGGNQTQELKADTSGEEVTWVFDVAAERDYDIEITPVHVYYYGIYEIFVDGAVHGSHDFYGPSPVVATPFTVARLSLTPGQHTLTFRNIGRGEEATGYKMGVTTLAVRDVAALPNPSQVNLSAAPQYGNHAHSDALSLTLWAEGQEILPDIGYTHTRFSTWGKSTLAHNTVSVDSANLDRESAMDGGSVSVFDDADPHVQVMRADYTTAYPQTSRYEREIWSIGRPGTTRDEGYVLDLFRVSGGNRHELAFHGDANHDAAMATPATLTDYNDRLLPPGTEVVEPTNETEFGSAEGHWFAYMHVKEVQTADLADGAFDVTVSTELDDGPGASLRLQGAAGGDTQLFLGRSPSMRSTRLHGVDQDTNAEAEKYTMPSMVLRRNGTNLDTAFVTVIEPIAVGADSAITDVALLDHDGSSDDLAVQISHATGEVDIVLSTHSSSASVTAAGVTLTGQLGWARLSGDQVLGLHLVSGTALSAHGEQVSAEGPISGTVRATLRMIGGDSVDAILTDAAVAQWAIGRTVVVSHPSGPSYTYRITDLDTHQGHTALILDGVDPGFHVVGDTVRMLYTPFSEWTGQSTFRIENSNS